MLQRLNAKGRGTLDCDLNFSNGDRWFASARASRPQTDVRGSL